MVNVMDISIQPFLNEILGGSGRAVVSILIIVIIVLIKEIRSVRTELKEANDDMDKQREDFLKIVDNMQNRFSDKTTEMIEKYHEALKSKQEQDNRMYDVINTIKELILRNSNRGGS